MTELSMEEFTRMLKESSSKLERRILRLTFDLATSARELAIRNADQNFNKTQRENSRGIPQAGSKGTLRSSILLALVGRHPGVVAGGTAAPYAAIHEFGGVITPKKKKWLTIPMLPELVGKRAGEQSLVFVPPRDGKRSASLIFPDRFDSEGNPLMAYLLVKKVTMPERPYLRPAVEEACQDESVQALCRKVFGDDTIPWEVTTT